MDELLCWLLIPIIAEPDHAVLDYSSSKLLSNHPKLALSFAIVNALFINEKFVLKSDK